MQSTINQQHAGQESQYEHRRTESWLWLTAPLALLLAIASGVGFFVPDFYHRDAEYLAAQGVGQDFVNLFLVLPLLVVSAWLAGRGGLRSRVVCLGTLAYLTYSYVVYAVASNFNQLFLVYVGILGLSFYALVGGLLSTDQSAVKRFLEPSHSRKIVSVYLLVVALLFCLLWLSEIVPAILTNATPQSIIDNGTPTSAVHVLDLAILLPATLLTGIWLWQRVPLAYTLAGMLLIKFAVLGTAIIAMVAFMVVADQPVEMPMLMIFVVITLVSAGLAIWFLSNGHQDDDPDENSWQKV